MHMEPPARSQLDFLNVFQIKDLLAIGTEEASRVELTLKGRERTAEQRPLPAPPQANVISLGTENAYLSERYKPTTRSVANKELLQRQTRSPCGGAGTCPDLLKRHRKPLWFDW